MTEFLKYIAFAALWLPVAVYGADIHNFISGDPAVIAEADIEPLRGTPLEQEIKAFNRKISSHFKGQYDFSTISEQLEKGLFYWNGDFINPDFAVLVQGTMSEADFNRILAESVDEKLVPITLNGRRALCFPQESLNKKLRGKMDIVSAFVTDDIVMIGNRKDVAAALISQVESVPEKAMGQAFLRLYGRPSDTGIGMFFRGVKYAVIEVTADETGRGVEIAGVANCLDANTASVMAVNMKMLIQAFLPLLLNQDIALQNEVLSGMQIVGAGDQVKLVCKMNGVTVSKLFRYAERYITR